MAVVTNGYKEDRLGDWPAAQRATEVESIYVQPHNRWVVSLVVGYDEEDGVPDAKDAALSALELTRDGSQAGTQWFVYDRQTGHTHLFEQEEFDGNDD